MADQIFIDRIQCRCRIGATREERELPQTLIVSICLFLDLKPAGLQDDLKTTVDYAKVTREVKNLLESRPFALIEAVAEQVVCTILERYSVDKVSVEVIKKPFPDVEQVGVRIERTK